MAIPSAPTTALPPPGVTVAVTALTLGTVSGVGDPGGGVPGLGAPGSGAPGGTGTPFGSHVGVPTGAQGAGCWPAIGTTRRAQSHSRGRRRCMPDLYRVIYCAA